jgi:hypothetical protein
MCFVKILLSKVKLSHYHHANAKRERIYSSYSFLTSALNEGERSASHPGHILSPGQDPLVPIGYEAGWASELSWTQRLEEKSFASASDGTLLSSL